MVGKRQTMISMVHVRMIKTSVACAMAVLASGLVSSPISAGVPPSRIAASAGQAQTDLDAFMAGVLERRDENWKKLQQYLLEERERLELKGPSSQVLWGEDRTYMWYIRDGFFVRSPLVANGVSVPDERPPALRRPSFSRAPGSVRRSPDCRGPGAGRRPSDRRTSDLGGSAEPVAAAAVH